jgi:3-oxoacyl-[acyl-carrier-protein] synthase II
MSAAMSAATSPVLTGVGVVSAFGVGRQAFWSGLAAGACGVRPIRHFDASAQPTRFAGEVPALRTDADWLLPQLPGLTARQVDLLRAADRAGALRDRKVAFLLLAAWEAWQHAGCGSGEQSASLALALGLEQAFLDDLAAALRPGQEAELDFRRPLAGPPIRFRSPVDLGARLLRELLALRGEVAVNVSACAAGGLAMARAAALIRLRNA